ncbi:hypothetical protein D910_01357, partial [Dendroctonus ponderosae]
MIENLKKTYALDDTLLATCTSGFGDPKPTLKFFINKQQTTVLDLHLVLDFYPTIISLGVAFVP